MVLTREPLWSSPISLSSPEDSSLNQEQLRGISLEISLRNHYSNQDSSAFDIFSNKVTPPLMLNFKTH